MEINILIEEDINSEAEAGWLQKVVERVLTTQEAPPNAEVGLVITGQEQIRELNRDYRGMDKPTDVLAFYMQPLIPGVTPPFISPPDNIIHLGEVLISYPQAVLQAKERRHSVKKELAILIIHGVLHLLGFDHEKSDMKKQMVAREAEILSLIEKELI